MSSSTDALAKKLKPSMPRYKDPRDSLGPYTTHPEAFPPTTVIYHNANSTCVRDLYPKSVVHTLLLPRDAVKKRMHPFEAFEDTAFLQSVKDEAQNLKRLVAAELKRKYGDQNGRDWEAEVKVGVHAKPSMNHLHVHVMSREHFSERLKTGKHYNSFNTPFFVGLDEFPLAEDDVRRLPHTGFTKGDLICWKCRRNFGNRCKQLKEHLEEEFEKWKKEPERPEEKGKGKSKAEEGASAEGEGDETE